MKIYVGNLSFETTESQINEAFSQHGDVQDVAIISDRMTGRSRGFGFVEMRNDQSAKDAIEALNGTDLGGRHITVNEARPREDRGGPKRDRW